MTGCAPSWRSRRGPGSRRCGVGGVPSLIGLHFRFSHDGLRAELEEQKGPWFEEVRRWRGSLPDRTSLQVFP